MKQTDKILKWMMTEGEITPLEKGTNRFGETVHYAVYWLEEVAA